MKGNQGQRRFKVSLNVALQVFLCLWLVFVVNRWAFHHSWRIDLTADHRYALTPEMVNVLAKLDRPVDVIIPYSFGREKIHAIYEGVMDRAVRLCREFELENPLFRIAAHLHVGANPAGWSRLREQFSIDHPNQIYLFREDRTRREVLTLEDLADVAIPTIRDPRVVPRLRRERAGEALITALQRLLLPDRPTVYFTQGHGEVPFEGLGRWSVRELRNALRDRGYRVAPLNLAHTDASVPEDARLVIVIGGGPKFDTIRGPGRDALNQYLDRGGALLAFLPLDGPLGLENRFRDVGIKADRPGVVAAIGTNGQPGPNLLITDFNPGHPVTRGFVYEEFLAEISYSRCLEVEEPATAILFSSADSWLNPGVKFVHLQEYPTGPFQILAAYEPPPDAPVTRRGRIAVHGSWLCAVDAAFRRRGGSARTLLNTVYWLTERADLAAAPGRPPVVKRVVLDPARRSTFFWMSVFVLPACPLVGGMFVFWLRRR